jgi:hypothetical protein
VNKWSKNLAEAASEDQVESRPDSLWHSRLQIALLEEEDRRRLSQARQGEHQHDAPQPATLHSDAVRRYLDRSRHLGAQRSAAGRGGICSETRAI